MKQQHKPNPLVVRKILHPFITFWANTLMREITASFIGVPSGYSVGRVNPAVLVYCLAMSVTLTAHRSPYVLLSDHEEGEDQEEGGGDKPVKAEHRAINVYIGGFEGGSEAYQNIKHGQVQNFIVHFHSIYLQNGAVASQPLLKY